VAGEGALAELAALTIAQVDQADRMITVDRKVVEVAAHLYVEAPKCRKYRRTIYPRRTPDGYSLAERLAAQDRGGPQRYRAVLDGHADSVGAGYLGIPPQFAGDAVPDLTVCLHRSTIPARLSASQPDCRVRCGATSLVRLGSRLAVRARRSGR